MVTHRLSETGEAWPPDFKLGDHVCTVHEDGSPNLADRGIIVAGVWDNMDNVGGAPAANYTVKVGEGKYFKAERHRLMHIPGTKPVDLAH